MLYVVHNNQETTPYGCIERRPATTRGSDTRGRLILDNTQRGAVWTWMTVRRGVVSAHIDLDILNRLNILNRRQYAEVWYPGI